MQDRASLKATIAKQINTAIDYLENHILYNHDGSDITADFFSMLDTMEQHLDTDVQDENSFHACQRFIVQLTLYIITTIKYQNDQTDFLMAMRSLMDNLTIYSQNNLSKSPVVERFFDKRGSKDETSNKKTLPEHRNNAPHSSH
jgi:hypothetical protein